MVDVSTERDNGKRRRTDDASFAVPSGAAPEALCHVPCLVERFAHTPDVSKLVFVMVGLPARGKSFISLRLARLLEWTGAETRVFNAGNHRRSTETGVQDASYFDPDSICAAKRREEIAMEVMDEMLAWLQEGGARVERFAVFDATNTTRARRRVVAEKIGSHEDVGVVFVESICNDASVVQANVAMKLEKSPDYKSLPHDEARKDLLQRISNYEKVYEPVHESEMMVEGGRKRVSYIKLLNLSSHVIAHCIWGKTATTVLPYLMALHVGSRPIWLVRLPHANLTPHAWRTLGKPWPPPPEIQFAEQPLSDEGSAFLEALAAFVGRQASSIAVFTCTHRRGLDVAARLGGGRARTSLNPQNRGVCDGLSPVELVKCAPEVSADPLRRRFHGGESLADMVQRLLPTLIEIEQEMRPVVVVAPQSALQVIYCYYSARPVSQALKAALPLHGLVEMRASGGNFKERRFSKAELQA